MRDSLTSTSVWLQHTHRFGYLWKLIGWVSTATPTSGMANDSLLLRRWSNRLSSCGLVTHSTTTVVGGSTEGLTPTDSLAKSGWLRGWLDTNSTPLLGGRIHAHSLWMSCGFVRACPREAWCLDGDSHTPTYHFRYARREATHTLGGPVGVGRRSPRSVVTHSRWVGPNLGRSVAVRPPHSRLRKQRWMVGCFRGPLTHEINVCLPHWFRYRKRPKFFAVIGGRFALTTDAGFTSVLG